jgi:hypothetical protein
MDDKPHALIAYRIGSHPKMSLAAASANRDWMDETDRRFANRCLPMLIANQAGWMIRNGRAFRAMWLDRADLDGVVIEPTGGTPCAASSHFGHGILTFTLPFLFRTPPGVSLLFRGPANAPKDAIAPLEGLVETDWAVATATMNWQFTRAHTWVEFAKDEPICMLVPQQFELLEAMHPRVFDIAEEPRTNQDHRAWSESRRLFNEGLRNGNLEAVKTSWQRHYFRGTGPNSGTDNAESHRTRLKIREFESPHTIQTRALSVSKLSAKSGPVNGSSASSDILSCPVSTKTSTSIKARSRSSVADLPPAEEILSNLVIIDDFIPGPAAQDLIEAHRRWAKLGGGDNGLSIEEISGCEPSAFELAKSIVARIIALIESHFHEDVRSDLVLITAITGTFRHTLHADNTLISCPHHGTDAEELVRLNCQCEDIQLLPNHTSWRRFTALLYLDSDHDGGNIIFGEGPNVFGRLYRKEITVRSGLLVLSPSNELYYHRTTEVSRGTRYSMNSWFL